MNVPVLFGYTIDNRTSFLLGTEFGYLVSVREVYSSAENFNVKKSYPTKVDVGIDIGLDYKIKKDIGIEVRYGYGLNTYNYVDAVGIRCNKIKGARRVFQIGVNYMVFK